LHGLPVSDANSLFYLLHPTAWANPALPNANKYTPIESICLFHTTLYKFYHLSPTDFININGTVFFFPQHTYKYLLNVHGYFIAS